MPASARLPIHITELISKYSQARERLFQRLGREPKTSELSKLMGMPPDKVREAARALRQSVVSLEEQHLVEAKQCLIQITPFYQSSGAGGEYHNHHLMVKLFAKQGIVVERRVADLQVHPTR